MEKIKKRRLVVALLCLAVCVSIIADTQAETADGHVAFYPESGTDAPLKYVGVLIQNGEGMPSPSNIRPFNKTVTLTQYGRNLISPSLYTNSKGGLTWTVNSDGSISISGICNASGVLNIMTRYLKRGIYRLQGAFGCGPASIEIIGADNSVSYGIVQSSYRSKLIWLPQDGMYVIRYIHLTSDASVDAVAYPMLTEGTLYYDYEKYTEMETNLFLPENFGGGYIDSNGTVVVTHYRAVLTEESKLSAPSAENGGTYRFLLQDYSDEGIRPALGEWDIVYDVRCTALNAVAYSTLKLEDTPYTIGISNKSGQIFVRLPFATTAEAKKWFGEMEEAGTPVEIIYRLETPIELKSEGFPVMKSDGPQYASVSQGRIEAALSASASFQAQKHSPVMTFVDDDGRSGSIEVLKYLMENAHIPVSSALVTYYVDDDGNPMYMNWSDVAQLQSMGASFFSHTNAHMQLDTSIIQPDGVFRGQAVTLEEIEKDFTTTQRLLKEHGCNTDLLVYPHGTLTPETEAVVRKYFSGGVLIAEGMNELPIRPYKLMRYNLPKTQSSSPVTRTLEDWKQLADYCAASGGWLIWMMHSYSDNYTQQQLADIVSLCEYASELGIKIMGLDEGFHYMNNRVTDGDINGRDYYIVDRDGNVYTDRNEE